MGAMPQYTPRYTAILKTSTRVLMALAERQKPADRDVAKLQRFAPQRAHEDIYVLAYHVAQEALQKRRESRAARQMTNQERPDARMPAVGIRSLQARFLAPPFEVSL